MKPCPFCSEQIQPAAVKCRFCGEWLDPNMRPAWSGSDLAALTEQITREVTRQLSGSDTSTTARPPRKRSSTRDIPSDPHRAGVIAPDEAGTRSGTVEFEPQPQSEPRTPPPYEEPGPYPGLGGPGAPARTLGQPAPRAARWTPGGAREESGPKVAAAPSWSPPLSTPEPEPRESDPVWSPPEWLTAAKRHAAHHSAGHHAPPHAEAELPSWSPPPPGAQSQSPKPSWSAPAAPPPSAPAPAWAPPGAARPADPSRAAAAAPSEDEFVDGGFGSEFADDEFDDGPGEDDDFPPLDLAAASGRHRKRRRRLDQPAIEIPPQSASATPPPIEDPNFDELDQPAARPTAAAAKPAAGKPERPKAKHPRDDDDDDDFDDDDDDDDDFDDDDDDEDPAAASSSTLDASVTAQKRETSGRKLPWIPISAVAGGLVLVLAFAFREQLFGPSDDAAVAEAGETAAETEPAPEPEPEPKPEQPKPEPEPKPQPPAIPQEELDAKVAEATSLVNRQKYDDARVILDEVLAKVPTEGRALALVAQIQLEKNKLADALATADQCVAADPQQAFCWIIIATVEQGNDNLPRALEAYRKYLEVEPQGQHAKSAKKQITRLESKVPG